MLPWLHPIVGTLAVSLILWTGWLGLNARQRRPEAPAARRRHRSLAPIGAVLAGLALVAGIGSVLLLREDMTLAETWHFRTGLATASLAAVAALLSRNIHRHPRRKALHPWVGVLLMLAAGSTLFLGLEHLP